MASRTSVPVRERRLRSRLLQLLREGGLLHGNLVERKRKCGNPGCRCQRGEGHYGLYFSFSRDGKQRQIYVPRKWEDRIRDWVARDREVRELLDQLSELHREQLTNREKAPRSGGSAAT